MMQENALKIFKSLADMIGEGILRRNGNEYVRIQ